MAEKLSIATTAVVAGALAVHALLKRGRRKTVVVVGATTQVGQAVIKALLQDGRFRVRAVITDPARYTDSIRGCFQSVPANSHNPFSLNQAMLGADYGFLTLDDTGLQPDQYLTLARKLADAAKGAELEHCVWYTTEAPDSLNGVPKTGLAQLEAEVESARYARQTGMQLTVVAGSFTFESLLDFAKLTLDRRAHMVTLPLGSVPVPAIALESIGRCVAAVLAYPLLYRTRCLTLATEKRTLREYCDALSTATGKHFAYNEVGSDVFGMAASHRTMSTLCQLITARNKPYCLSRATGTAAKLVPDCVSFEAWAKVAVKPNDPNWEQQL